MKINKFFLLLSITLLAILFYSCSDDTEVGYGLLDNEDLEVSFSDDVQIIAKTVDPGALISYITGSPLTSLLIGNLNDPVFGTFSSSVYLSPSIITGVLPEFSGGTYDSTVLTLVLDTLRFAGSQEEPHDIEVFQIINPIQVDTLYTDSNFDVATELIGSKAGVVPSAIDSLFIPDGLSDTTLIGTKDLIRIRMNDRRFGGALFADTSIYSTTIAVRDKFAGLEIRSSAENSLFAISNTSYMSIYYHDAEGNFKEFIFYFSQGPLGPKMTSDLENSSIAPFLDVPVTETGYVYLQGFTGSNVELDIGAIHQLDDVLINHAAIEFVMVDEIVRDTALFPRAERIILSRQGENGPEEIEDITIARALGSDLLFYGGNLEKDTEINKFKYEMNITSHIVDVLNGNQGDILYLSVPNKISNPNSAILYGPDHPQYPTRLKLTYTKP